MKPAKWDTYQRSRAIGAVLEAQRDFGDMHAVVEWAKTHRRGVSDVALARLESARDALGRRVVKMVAAMPPDMFRRKGARGS